MGHKLPITSHFAKAQVTQEMLDNHYGHILKALSVLKSANYETISLFCKLDKHAIGRRMVELLEMGKVWKPGGQSKTSSNRLAFNYQLTSEPTPITPEIVKEPKFRSKSIAEHSKAIQKIQKQVFNQPTLF